MRRVLMAGAASLLMAACGGTDAPTPVATSESKPAATAPATVAPTSPAAAPSLTTAPATPAAATTSPAGAASPTGAAGAATRTPATAGTVTTPNSTGTPAGSPLSGARSIEQIQNLSSFRFTMAMKIEGKNASGQDVTMSFDLSGEETRNPAAAHWTMNVSGTPSGQGGGSLEMYQVQDETYIRQGSAWIKSPVPATSLLESQGLFQPDDFASQLAGGQLIGTETVNGRAATHYRFDKAALLANSTLDEADRQQFANLDSATLDVWLDNQDRFLSRFQMTTTGKQDIGEPLTGTMAITYEVKDVNASFTITIPDAARQAG